MSDEDLTAPLEPGTQTEVAPEQTQCSDLHRDGTHAKQPECIGRYRVDRVLGKGSFGVVYLAYDESLQRSVALKLPHARLLDHDGLAEAYLTEARTVANLDHTNIVPVHDVGSTDEFPVLRRLQVHRRH